MKKPRTAAPLAFTLIEMLLVMAIIGIVSAIVVPSFVRSIRGNRLRTAARTVVMAGRYARSMAVLEQRDMAVTFQVGGGGVHVDPAQMAAPPADTNAAAGAVAEPPGPSEPAAATPAAGGEASPEASGESPRRAPVDLSVSRTLDRVRIQKVEVTGGEEGLSTTGAARVVYFTNGTCQPYRLTIEDEFGSEVTVTVDALSTVETETVEKE